VLSASTGRSWWNCKITCEPLKILTGAREIFFEQRNQRLPKKSLQCTFARGIADQRRKLKCRVLDPLSPSSGSAYVSNSIYSTEQLSVSVKIVSMQNWWRPGSIHDIQTTLMMESETILFAPLAGTFLPEILTLTPTILEVLRPFCRKLIPKSIKIQGWKIQIKVFQNVFKHSK